MKGAQQALLIALECAATASGIAQQIRPALGDEGDGRRGDQDIAGQMQAFLASDVA